jgi:hypothetical protein
MRSLGLAVENMNAGSNTAGTGWRPIATAPYDCDLELAVLEGTDAHVLIVRCRRVAHGWIDAATKRRVEIDPTHWREWRGS